MKRINLLVAFACSAVALAGCAPITPLPGGMPAPIPQPPSAGGAPSTPSGTPPSLPGGSPSLPGGQPGGQPSQPSGSEPSGEQGGEQDGQPSSDSSGGLPGGEMPGGQPGGMPGSTDPNSSPDGQTSVPTWDVEQGGAQGGEGSETGASPGSPGGQGNGDDGWETSNEIPGTPGSADGDDGETGSGQAGAAGEGNGGTPSGDDELEGALKDFDGEILAEREIISSSQTGNAEGGAGASTLPTGSETQGQGSGGDVSSTSGPLPPRRQIPAAPPPPPRGSESGPENLPDARDDDIIARQLREAAMQETDPELKEKLWDEYRKYKKG